MAQVVRINADGIVDNVVVTDDTHSDGNYGASWLSESTGETWIASCFGPDNTPVKNIVAGIDFSYNSLADVFIAPKPFPSWVLDESTWTWQAPVPMPEITEQQAARWNEESGEWEIF
jgi:hypothetical protein